MPNGIPPQSSAQSLLVRTQFEVGKSRRANIPRDSSSSSSNSSDSDYDNNGNGSGSSRSWNDDDGMVGAQGDEVGAQDDDDEDDQAKEYHDVGPIIDTHIEDEEEFINIIND